VLLALVAGGLLGRWRTYTRRAAISGAAATLMLTIAMAGPVPVGRSLRAVSIFLAVLPTAVTAGAILGVLSWSLRSIGTFAQARHRTTAR
jgi:hypothetical protein